MSSKSKALLLKAGYKIFTGKGFVVEEGETAYVNGQGKDAHVVVVGEGGIREYRPYGSRAGQFDVSYITPSQLGSLLKKLARVRLRSRDWYKAIAKKHKAADKSCGRKWVCACGACKVARGKHGH